MQPGYGGPSGIIQSLSSSNVPQCGDVSALSAYYVNSQRLVTCGSRYCCMLYHSIYYGTLAFDMSATCTENDIHRETTWTTIRARRTVHAETTSQEIHHYVHVRKDASDEATITSGDAGQKGSRSRTDDCRRIRGGRSQYPNAANRQCISKAVQSLPERCVIRYITGARLGQPQLCNAAPLKHE